MSDQTLDHETESIHCPKCWAEQQPGEVCQVCGLIFAKYRPIEPPIITQIEASRQKPASGIRPIYVLLLLVAVLAAILSTRLPVQELHATFIQSTEWSYDLRMFQKGQTQNQLMAMLKQDGFDFKFTEYPGVAKEDVFVCQVLLSKIWGIPAKEVNLFFGRDNGLNSLLFTFASDQYPAITQKLNQYGQKSNDDYGTDADGGKVEAWITEGGVAMTSSVPATTGIKVYWVRHDLMHNNDAEHTEEMEEK